MTDKEIKVLFMVVFFLIGIMFGFIGGAIVRIMLGV